MEIRSSSEQESITALTVRHTEKNKKLNTLIAKRYAKHPAIEAWQVDNELGWSNTTRCYCKSCENRFRSWLKEKYGTIDNLNKTYGTTFWSQTYRSFEELNIPKAGACYDTCHDTQGQNPALLLDYYRFCSDSVVEFTKESVDTIKEYSDLPITSNLLDAAINSGTGIDYFKLSKEFDFVTWDNYIEFQWGKAKPETVSRDHALLRSYKKRPFWVMEQQSGPCGWSKMGPTPTPGKLRLWTYQSVANGADTVVYFRWRACPFGTEELWHGILNHDGKPNRRYSEISRVGAEMEELSKNYRALMPRARVAIIKSFDSEWSQSIHRQVEGLYYDSLLLDYYRPFWNMGIPVDFVTAEEDLNKYDLVLAPMLMMVSDEGKKNIECPTDKVDHHYRDPKVWKTGDTWYMTFGVSSADKSRPDVDCSPPRTWSAGNTSACSSSTRIRMCSCSNAPTSSPSKTRDGNGEVGHWLLRHGVQAPAAS